MNAGTAFTEALITASHAARQFAGRSLLRHAPLKRRLTLIVLLASGITLTLTSILFTYGSVLAGHALIVAPLAALVIVGAGLLCMRLIDRAIAPTTHLSDELQRTSRRAGMTEIATNVLHNVGNVLNSVNVSATLLADTIRKSRVEGLGRAVDVLREHDADLAAFMAGERGRHLPQYLSNLAGHLAQSQESSLKELSFLRHNIDHIRAIVTMQQAYASGAAAAEPMDIRLLVEDAVRVNLGALTRMGVHVVREFTPVPAVSVDAHKVLQILINLVRNALHACSDAGRVDRQLTLRIEGRQSRVLITVADNGVGIPAENLDRLFRHGFTTRKDGHGFGLHSCAQAAQELGGTLRAHSEGPGRGAAFTLELPLPD